MKAVKWLDENFEEIFLIFLCVILCTLMMLNVILRYVFNSSIVWADEVCRYCFITSAFTGFGYCARKRKFIRMESVKQKFPYKVQCIIEAFIDILMGLFFSYYFLNSTVVITNAIKGKMASPVMLMPMAWLYGVCVAAYALGALRSFQKSYFDIKDFIRGKPMETKADKIQDGSLGANGQKEGEK